MNSRERLESSVAVTAIDHLPLAIRAYVPLADAKPAKKQQAAPRPSDWVLVFDTETTIDAAQRLRFGTFQVRKSAALTMRGILYDPAALTKRERNVLLRYAEINCLELLMVEDFIEKVFFKYGAS